MNFFLEHAFHAKDDKTFQKRTTTISHFEEEIR
ncbi:hypothetical protein OCC_14440 [Thermococcus litoralis DSM 5473]|uniref:Uncharacterized protein n=1 Tax=Thermococcus litoralis (strain ATCC 51850 / DSM 5473 / JCM 8560 / NS-C) TaxID=523849 RepID=S5ZTX8_THELN|nr:hypothetical protein OCC_14440 [Thermococcus litoralis DSM 5473]